MPISRSSAAARVRACFDMVTTLPARLMNPADYGVAVGHPADLVVIDSRDPARRWPSSRTAARLQARPTQFHPRSGNAASFRNAWDKIATDSGTSRCMLRPQSPLDGRAPAKTSTVSRRRTLF